MKKKIMWLVAVQVGGLLVVRERTVTYCYALKRCDHLNGMGRTIFHLRNGPKFHPYPCAPMTRAEMRRAAKQLTKEVGA